MKTWCITTQGVYYTKTQTARSFYPWEEKWLVTDVVFKRRLSLLNLSMYSSECRTVPETLHLLHSKVEDGKPSFSQRDEVYFFYSHVGMIVMDPTTR